MLVILLINTYLQVISALLLVPLCVALSVLLGWHIYLILHNKTTIEVIKKIDKLVYFITPMFDGQSDQH